jgi:hypothetical protein
VRAAAAVILLAGASACLAGAAPDWPYDDGLDEPLLYLHPEVNYALHPEQQDTWERRRLGPGAMRLVLGSSATDELLIDTHWTMNPLLAGGGLRLRADLVWQEQRHLPAERQDVWFGLEQRVWRRWSVTAQLHPAEAKEEMDLRAGLTWASPDRERYVEVLYLAEDIVRDAKDDRRPVSGRSPRGVSWSGRLAHGAWSVYTEGRWAAGFSRRYPDSGASPDLAAWEGADNVLLVCGRCRPEPRTQVSLSWRHAEDRQRQTWREPDAAYSHDYVGWYRLLSARALVPLDGRWRLRCELHRVDRRVHADGWRPLAYRRRDIMPGLWVERRLGADHHLELGYLGSAYRWRRDEAAVRDDFADKVELAATFGLARGARLAISLSHEVSLERFGGASVRMVAPW